MEDAQILAELSEAVKAGTKDSFEKLIETRASYPYLYHLSQIRENLIDWLPITRNMHVLERNAECGALTGKLLQMAGNVTAVTESEAEAEIIRIRTGKAKHLTVFTEAEWNRQKDCMAEQGSRIQEQLFDRIVIVGSFYRFKEELILQRKLLKEQGRLIVADANRLGLKYMAGCQEEYQGGYFTGVEGYENEGTEEKKLKGRCYTNKEYRSILTKAGYRKLEYYYPYPDYMFPSNIYSDDYLPKKGELSDNRRNFERDRILLFDERCGFDTMIKEGLFPEFSNSFLIFAE